jgi:hypothetical protein
MQVHVPATIFWDCNTVACLYYVAGTCTCIAIYIFLYKNYYKEESRLCYMWIVGYNTDL